MRCWQLTGPDLPFIDSRLASGTDGSNPLPSSGESSANLTSSIRGEILKFMGDGVLAIFLTEDDEDFAPSSLRALAAATQGLERLAAIKQGPPGNRADRSADRESGCIWARSSTAKSALPTGSTSP